MTRTEGFAAIPNWMIRDERFDIYDIAVYMALASHTGPGGVRPSQATLAAEARCSERQVRIVIQRLADHGVLEVTRRRRTGAGMSRNNSLTNGYVLHPHGRLAPDEEPAPGAGWSDRPAPDDRPTGTAQQVTPLIEEEPVKKMGFAEFYMAYPRKVGKEAARRAFDKAAKSVDPDAIVEGARRYAADPNLPDRQFIPYPASWLNAGRWDDEPEAERPRVIHAPSMDDFAPGDEWMAFNR